MPQNVIPGAEIFRFKDMELHARLVSANYSRKRRVAVHEFLKRDGGQTEDMGREPFRVEVQVLFVGDTFREDMTRLAASLDENPSGLFVDPLFGQFPATCMGFERAMLEPDKAQNAITLPLAFVENNVDVRLSPAQSRGASTAAQGVTESVATFDEEVAAIVAAATLSAAVAAQIQYDAVSLSRAATQYAQAGLDAAVLTTIDPTLTTRLQSIATLTETMQATLGATVSEVVGASAIVASEMVAASCVTLQQAILDARPPMGRYTVPVPTTLAALAQQFYGIEGATRLDEILSNNPNLTNPAAIVAGTVLVLAQPTV